MKKILKFIIIFFCSLTILALLIPVLFKGRILKLVQNEINKNLVAKVEFNDVDLSIFRHFPKLSVGLKDISITGVDEFKNDTLLSAAKIDVSVNLISVLSGDNMNIHGVYLQSPRIHVLVNEDGKANWEITKEDSSSTSSGESSSFHINLEKYGITDGYVLYDDKSSNMKAEILGLNHEGSGDFTQDVFTLTTSTKVDEASFVYANIPYLVNAKTGIDAAFEIDNKSSKYSFKKADISVNDLSLLADGFLRIDNDSTYSMDMTFDAPSNDFKSFLSLVPAIYKTDFDKIKTSGSASFKGFVKGIYSSQSMPAYSVDLNIKDGFFQYPDLPQPVKNIQLAAKIANADGVMDHTVVDITKGHVEMGPEPFDFRLLFKNPETSKYIDAVVKGKLNLSDISKFIKLDNGTKLAGLVWADAFAKGDLSALQQQQGAFAAGGFFDIKNFFYSSKDFPQPLQNGNFQVTVENKGGVADATAINVSPGHIEVGSDPIDFSLQLSKPVSAVNFSGSAKGRFTLDNIKQFVTLDPGTSIKGLLNADLSFSGSKADIDQKAYERINTSGSVALSNIQYVSNDYPDGVQVRNAEFVFTPKTVALKNMSGQFMETNFTASGALTNLIAYALRDEELGGNVQVTADKINLNDLMSTDTAAATTSNSEASAPFAVPANINLLLDAKADLVQYDKVDYANVKGTLLLKDETVLLKNVQTNALDGTMAFDGKYSTKASKTNPDISLTYNVKDINIQKAFYAYNTIQKLMPLGKFLGGKLSSQFNMTGKLNGDMFPDLTSLTGNGNLLLIQGVLNKFAPLDKLATTLNVADLKDISLKDIKSYFEFANGKVLVKPFAVKVKEIDMQIGGMHGLDQSIDYIIGMKLPRKYLGANGNALVNNLTAQATAKGLPVSLSDVVELNVKMNGSITNPVLKTDLKQAAGDATKEMKEQATAFVQQKIDNTKQTVKDSLTAVKKEVVNDVKAELSKQIFGNKDSANKDASIQNTKEKATQTLKNTLGGLLKKKKQAADSTKSTSN